MDLKTLSNTKTPVKICKACKVELDFINASSDTRYKCPKCNECYFMDGTGSLKITNAYKYTTVHLSDNANE